MSIRVAPLSVAALLAAVAFADTLYPVYTVTTEGDGIVTNLLEECTVQVVDAEGAAPREVAYADLDKSAGNFHGTFVIDAASYLMGSVTMTNFTGVIRIARGALIVDAVGWLGVAESTQAPKLFVESGASLVPTCPVTRGGKIYNELHLAGNGYNGIGAFCNRYRASHSDYCFYNYIYLEADTLIGYYTTARIDMNANYARLVLNDHTLTVKDFGNRSGDAPTFCTYGARVEPGSGHIILDHISVLVQGGTATWSGGATNTITLLSGSGINYYNTTCNIYWKVIVPSGHTGYFYGGGSATHVPSSFPARNRNYYYGPVQVDGLLRTSTPYLDNRGVMLFGNISGSGDVRCATGHLQLAGSNTYTGATSVFGGNRTTLALWGEASSSTHSSGYFVTNAPIYLATDESVSGGDAIYDLPPLAYHISGTNLSLGASFATNNYTDGTVCGGMDARIASLKKTGNGTLSLLANFDITGRTEIVGGTVRLAPTSMYSAVPGLWEGKWTVDDEARADYVAGYGKTYTVADLPPYVKYLSRECLSNRVTSCAYLFGQKAWCWKPITSATYTGYIWNRDSTNVVVTLLGSFVDAWTFYVNGSKIQSNYNGATLNKGTATLKPGPNLIELRCWVNTTTSGGWMVPSKMPNWAPYMGFAMAYGTTDTNYDPADYFVPTNGAAACAGGDGFMFTRDPRLPEEFTAEELAATRTRIATLAMTPGTFLDLAGSPLFIKALEGSGSITNGDLTVKERWTVAHSDISGAALYLDGALAFGADATVIFDGEGARLSHDLPVEKPLVTAAGGIIGSPAFSVAQPNWKMKLSGDGKSLIAIYYPVGTKIILR